MYSKKSKWNLSFQFLRQEYLDYFSVLYYFYFWSGLKSLLSSKFLTIIHNIYTNILFNLK
jgi:hypothetical protein